MPAKVGKESDTTFPVFLCYRRKDGSDTATWLHENLDGVDVGTPDAPVTLDVYLDRAAPAYQDWRKIHLPSLQRSKALIFVVSPEASKMSSGGDWVKMELEWWLSHRETAPIVVDQTDAGLRWVPDLISRKWPNIQRVPVILCEDGKIHDEALSLQQITEGLRVSGISALFRELVERRRLIRRITVALALTVLFGAVSIIGLFATGALNERIRVTNESLAAAERLISELDKATSAARHQLYHVRRENEQTLDRVREQRMLIAATQIERAFVTRQQDDVEASYRFHVEASRALANAEAYLSLFADRGYRAPPMTVIGWGGAMEKLPERESVSYVLKLTSVLRHSPEAIEQLLNSIAEKDVRDDVRKGVELFSTTGIRIPERIRQHRIIFDELAGRKGYDEDFLGTTVPLLRVRDLSSLAKRVDTGGVLLTYQNFSLALHKVRRLAVFTAKNVDMHEHSTRPEPGCDYTRRGLTGTTYEHWNLDPRVLPNHQLHESVLLFDDRKFDKGHIVSRLSVSWGNTYEEVRRGTRDAFFLTNASPQVAEFNRSSYRTGHWGRVENRVHEYARSTPIVVFAGPKLTDADPVVALTDDHGAIQMQVPRRFWKIVVEFHEGQLRSFAYLFEQNLDGAVDVGSGVSEPGVWLVSTRDLEREIGLVTIPEVIHAADQHENSEVLVTHVLTRGTETR